MIISKSFFAIYDYIVKKECKYLEDIRLLVGNYVNNSEVGNNAKI